MSRIVGIFVVLLLVLVLAIPYDTVSAAQEGIEFEEFFEIETDEESMRVCG